MTPKWRKAWLQVGLPIIVADGLVVAILLFELFVLSHCC